MTAINTPRLLDGRLKLRHLVLLDALSRHGTVVGAAAALHITQPVATRSLQELEEIVGVTLFERGPRGVTPTVFGEAFTEHAQSVIAQLTQAGRHMVELADADRGTAIVGVHLAGSNLLLPRAIIELKRSRPNLTVIVREGAPSTLLVELAAGRIDLIVGRLTAPPEAPFTQELLYHESIDIVTRSGHPLDRETGVSATELAGFPWVVPGTETNLRRELEEFFTRHSLPWPANRVEATSYLTVRQLLVETDAIAVMPSLIARADGALSPVRVPFDTGGHKIGVTTVATRSSSPSVDALVDALHATAATHSFNG